MTRNEASIIKKTIENDSTLHCDVYYVHIVDT